MIRWINKAVLVFHYKFALRIWGYIKKIPLLDKLILEADLERKLLLFVGKFRKNTWGSGITFSTDIYGTKLTMIDYEPFDYYPLVLQGKVYESSLALQLKTLFKEYDSPTFVDIGAYIGYFTIYAGKLIGSSGQVISIEPHMKHYSRLLKNIEINGLEEITRTFNLALSDRDGMANMEGYDERVLHEVGSGNIQVVTFDQLCAKENICPDIIKIDVRGAEGKVLAGMSDTLKSKVSHLFCELHNDLLGFTIGEIVQTLEAAGLEVFEFTKHRELSGGKLVPISSDLLLNYNDRMLYARRKDKKVGDIVS
jgi:FkbM family methyltransferase